MSNRFLQQQVDDYLDQVGFLDIGVAPPGLLTVLVGEKIRITATVQYRGPAGNYLFRASIVQKYGLDYVVQAYSEKIYSLVQSATWTTYTLVSGDVVVGGTSLDTTRPVDVQVEFGDKWARVEGALTVIGVAAFQALTITDYSKVV